MSPSSRRRETGEEDGSSRSQRRRRRQEEEEEEEDGTSPKRQCTQENADDAEERRKLRTKYRELQHTIHGDKDELASIDSRRFMEIYAKIEDLHNGVKKPREQIADAEAVLDIVSCFATFVKETRRKSGISPAAFVGHIISDFSLETACQDDEAPAVIDWGELGLASCGIFKESAGLSTMLGPMDIEPKARKAPAMRRQRVRPTQCTQAEEVKDRSEAEANAQTDANMETMFSILKAVKKARLDALVLNRGSFSQTVENIFSLSFLVKDGRAAITFNEDGTHIVAPKNSPTAAARASGEAKNDQFVFRLDWACWLKMQENLQEGLELMPDRPASLDAELPLLTTPLVVNSRKQTRETEMMGSVSNRRRTS